ncbi:MAG: tRNA 4-thiouridine(8) synthase ThiI, partial [Niameybacter sp.]
MTNVFLVKYGELAIKGKNRFIFENRLVATIRKNLKPIGKFEVRKEQGRITVEPADDSIDPEIIIEKLSRIFGIIGISYGIKMKELSMETIQTLAVAHMKKELETKSHLTFKVNTRR